MEKKEKVELILEQMRYCLANKDYIRTQIISKKISIRFFEKVPLNSWIFCAFFIYCLIYFDRPKYALSFTFTNRLNYIINNCVTLGRASGFEVEILRVHDRTGPARGHLPQHLSPLPRCLRDAVRSRQSGGKASDPKARRSLCRSQSIQQRTGTKNLAEM